MNMRKLVLMLCCWLVGWSVQAQTIHWITFIDTTDPNVGEIDVNTHKILYSRWIHVVNAALAPMGYNSDIQDFHGRRTTPENCKKAILDLRCSPDDVVVFYYIGHGGRSRLDQSRFPQMCLAQSDESKFVPLEWIHEQLKKKNSRLTLTIGMCCNSVGYITPKTTPTFGVNYGNTYLSEKEIGNIQSLFLQNRGNLIASSSIPNQNSSACGSDLGPTDYFTYTLIKTFEEQMSQANTPSWNSFFDSITSIVDNVTGKKQTPQSQIEIVSVNAPKKRTHPTVEEERQPSTEEDDNNRLGNYLSRCFDVIIDSSVDEISRLEVGEKVLELFDTGAKIRILGQDSDIVIDRESASDFIGRISTSRLLLKVAWVSGTLNQNGKIKNLSVREYYKKK